MVRWSCGTTKSMMPNDRAFLIKLGSEPKGIIGSGIVRTSPFISSHFNDETKESNYVDIEFDILLNPEKEPILSFDTLRSNGLSEQNWTPQASGTSVRAHLIEKLEKVWFEFLAVNKIRYNPFIPSEKETFEEGSATQVLQTRYERNPYAREACLNYYGYSCNVCKFNFGETYGEIGKNFIHVHHLNQVAAIGKSYKVDPIIDLRPVCPNCHAMLHKQNPPYAIEEMVSFLKSRRVD
jgi:5-methylcytosine-specific restriction protein A